MTLLSNAGFCATEYVLDFTITAVLEGEMTLEEVELVEKTQEVTQLKFSDGMIIHTHGPMRIVEFSDGWYVVGEGKMIPVKDEEGGMKYTMKN